MLYKIVRWSRMEPSQMEKETEKEFAKYGLPPLNAKAINQERLEESVRIIAADNLFSMVSDIVSAGADCVRKRAGPRAPVRSEIEVGCGIKALTAIISAEKYANACIIGGNIRISRHDIKVAEGRGDPGLKQIFIALGKTTLFEAVWGWESVDKRSLRISTAPEAKAAYAAIYDAWLKLTAKPAAVEDQY